MKITTAVLGADDPEMKAIEAVLRSTGVAVLYACDQLDGQDMVSRRVSPGQAYAVPATSASPRPGVRDPALPAAPGPDQLWVECMPDPALAPGTEAYLLRADHHRSGDPGYGRPPAEFWPASSLGQVCALLGVEPTDELRLIAAADHCLAAAYRGQCPGVDPDALLDWRLTAPGSPHTSAPDGQGGRRLVPPEVVRERALLARYMLAPGCELAACRPITPIGGVVVVDLRVFGSATVGLPLADVAARLGLAYVLRVREGWPERLDWREKVVLGGCGEGSVPGVVPMASWESWCRSQGYTGEIYGDPARGYAGCYIARRDTQS